MNSTGATISVFFSFIFKNLYTDLEIDFAEFGSNVSTGSKISLTKSNSDAMTGSLYRFASTNGKPYDSNKDGKINAVDCL